MYLECKFYGSQKLKTWRGIPTTYMKKQKKQYQAFKKLAKRAPVYFLTVAKEANEAEARAVLVELSSCGSWTKREFCDI